MTIWVHPATFTYSMEAPDRAMERLWVHRRGWGYLCRRDVWLKVNESIERLQERGYEEKKRRDDASVLTCPHCRMHVSGIPSIFVKKHLAECGGREYGSALDEMLIDGLRMRAHEAKLLAAKMREIQEQEEEERKERLDRMKEDLLSRQSGKDRKKKLKEGTKQELKNRYK